MQRFQISPGRVTAANGRMHWRPTPRQVVPNQKPHPGPRGWSVAWNEPQRTDCNPLQSFAILCKGPFCKDSIPIRFRFESGSNPIEFRWPPIISLDNASPSMAKHPVFELFHRDDEFHLNRSYSFPPISFRARIPIGPRRCPP